MEIEQIQDRIKQLRENHTSIEAQLRLLESRKLELQQTLLRISGAIQVLEEVESEMTSQPGKS